MHRRYFLPKLGELLREEVLSGLSACSAAEVRPQGLSMLAELVHHVRLSLTYPQIVDIIHKFSR